MFKGKLMKFVLLLAILFGGALETSANQVTVNTHTVVKGDTLYKIATINKTSVNELVDFNGLKSQMIKLGQKIQIPAKVEQFDVSAKINSLTKNQMNITFQGKKINVSYPEYFESELKSFMKSGEELEYTVEVENGKYSLLYFH